LQAAKKACETGENSLLVSTFGVIHTLLWGKSNVTTYFIYQLL
jgi:hypothetical protein